MFKSFEKACGISNSGQALQWLEKFSSCPDRSTTTDKAKRFASSRIHRYPDPAFGLFSDKVAEFIDFNKRAGLRLEFVDW